MLLLAVTACGGGTTPEADDVGEATRTSMEFKMAVVKTATPTPAPTTTQIAKPTATWVPLPTPAPTSDEPTQADVPRIGVAEAKAKADAGQAIIVDVRTQASFEKQHIAGAISIPSGQIAQRHSELPTDKLVIFYCA